MEPAGAPAQPDFSSLSPQLRKRVEREMSRGDVVSKSMRNGLIAVSVVATVAIMFILLQRFGAIEWPVIRGDAGRQAAQGTSAGPDGALITPAKAPDPTAAIIDSLKREVETAKRNPPVRTISTGSHEPEPARSQATPVVDQLDLDAPALPPESEAPARKAIVPAPAKHESAPAPAKSESAQAPAMNEAVPVPAKAATNDSFFGVGVAAFLDAERAREEKDRLVRDTSLPGVVMPFKDEGTTMYRVVLGHWSTSSDAERAANGLMEKGLINEARVVTFPKK
jgi:hypothetical protein